MAVEHVVRSKGFPSTSSHFLGVEVDRSSISTPHQKPEGLPCSQNRAFLRNCFNDAANSALCRHESLIARIGEECLLLVDPLLGRSNLTRFTPNAEPPHPNSAKIMVIGGHDMNAD